MGRAPRCGVLPFCGPVVEAGGEGVDGKSLLILCRVGQSVEADLKLQITRSSRVVPGWTWVPELAPSPDLFAQYLAWKHRGEWPARWPEYREAFLEEMGLPAARAYLAKLKKALAAGKTVALSCFCREDTYCHRRLVGELLGCALPRRRSSQRLVNRSEER